MKVCKQRGSVTIESVYVISLTLFILIAIVPISELYMAKMFLHENIFKTAQIAADVDNLNTPSANATIRDIKVAINATPFVSVNKFAFSINKCIYENSTKTVTCSKVNNIGNNTVNSRNVCSTRLVTRDRPNESDFAKKSPSTYQSLIVAKGCYAGRLGVIDHTSFYVGKN